jgi:hypothetical protein
MEEPKRKYQMTFKIGADSWDEILSSMDNFTLEMKMYHPNLDRNHNGVSGSPVAGYSYDVIVDPDMTHDKYFEQIDAYLAEREPARPADQQEDAQ